MSVQSQRIYTWAFETNISGPITPNEIAQAAAQFSQAGGARVWLLDAGAATAASPDVLGAISQAVLSLQALGLDRIAVVLPPIARAFVSMINVAPVAVYSFDSRNEAIDWIRRGCR